MGIPVDEYVKIDTKVIGGASGNPDFSCLVLTKDAMKTGASFEADYKAGKVISLTLDGVHDCFANTTDIYKFADKYFGYHGLVNTIHVRLVGKTGATSETAKDALIDAMKSFLNFGSVAVLGSTFTGTNINDVADLIESTDYIMLVHATTATASDLATTYAGYKNVFLVVGSDSYADWMGSAWYAAVDYDMSGASGTIDYKVFAGETATVNDAATKKTYDQKHINYIGQVQGRGIERKFMQNGVMMNGKDIGVFRDEKWIKALIEQGWFALNDEQTVPANTQGCSRVRSMILDVANRAVEAGAILVDKPLNNTQITTIAQVTGTTEAASVVQSCGYYIDAKIVLSGERYVCQYTLVYGKGDHIGSLSGVHYLI